MRYLLVVLIAGFAAGAMYLFGVQFAAGDVYPEYSSLRTDRSGTKLLFDSLSRLPGITTARNYMPLEVLNGTGSTVLLLGLNPQSFGEDADELQRIQQFAQTGNRVIVAMAVSSLTGAPMALALGQEWHVRFGSDGRRGHARLYFSEATDWTPLEGSGSKMTAIERDFGNGSVVLFASSADFVNETSVEGSRLELVALALGPYSHIVFDEQHLGIAESGSFVGLARRFRLTGLALGLAICAALFLWRSASGFPPPRPAIRPSPLSARTSLSGLITLLRRHIPPAGLAAVCWQEWSATNRRSVKREVAESAARIAGEAAKKPEEAIREIGALLHTKGNA